MLLIVDPQVATIKHVCLIELYILPLCFCRSLAFFVPNNNTYNTQNNNNNNNAQLSESEMGSYVSYFLHKKLAQLWTGSNIIVESRQ